MTYFLLPVYNEAENLPRLLETISRTAREAKLKFTIVAVDDGSTDRSAEVLTELSRTYPVHVLKHGRNQGPGQAFATGLTYILDKAAPEDSVITMEADNTHSTGTVGLIASTLARGYDVVGGSVYVPGGGTVGVPFFRLLVSRVCNWMYRVFFPLPGVTEYTGFYRGYRVGALRQAREALGGCLFTSPGFGSMAELLVRLGRAGLRMTEVAKTVHYDRKGGKSKMRVWRTIREHLKIISANRFRRRIIR